jgi:hypothetical protein
MHSQADSFSLNPQLFPLLFIAGNFALSLQPAFWRPDKVYSEGRLCCELTPRAEEVRLWILGSYFHLLSSPEGKLWEGDTLKLRVASGSSKCRETKVLSSHRDGNITLNFG